MSAVTEEEIEELRRLIAKQLDGTPHRYNDDLGRVHQLLRSMVRRKQLKGDYYCPCRMVTDDAEENARIVCPCAYVEEEIAAKGICHCGLVVGPKRQDGEQP